MQTPINTSTTANSGPSIYAENSVFESIYKFFQNRSLPVADRYGQMVQYGVDQILDSGNDTAGRDGAMSGLGRCALARVVGLAGGLGYLPVRIVEAADNARYEFSQDYKSGLDVAVSELYVQGASRLADAGEAMGVSTAFVLTDMWRKPLQALSAYRYGDMNQMSPARALDQIVGPFVNGALYLVPILGVANAICEVGAWGTASGTPYLSLTTGGLVPVSSGVIDAAAVVPVKAWFASSSLMVANAVEGDGSIEKTQQFDEVKSKMKTAQTDVDRLTRDTFQDRIRALYSTDPTNLVEDQWTQTERLSSGVSKIEWKVLVKPRRHKVVSGNARVRVDEVTVFFEDGSTVKIVTKRSGNVIDRRTVVGEGQLNERAKLRGETTTTIDSRGGRQTNESFSVEGLLPTEWVNYGV